MDSNSVWEALAVLSGPQVAVQPRRAWPKRAKLMSHGARLLARLRAALLPRELVLAPEVRADALEAWQLPGWVQEKFSRVPRVERQPALK
jgi:hypothetical protein